MCQYYFSQYIRVTILFISIMFRMSDVPRNGADMSRANTTGIFWDDSQFRHLFSAADGTGLLEETMASKTISDHGGRVECGRDPRENVGNAPPGRDAINGSDFRLRLLLLQIFLCLIRENVYPCFQSKAKTAPVCTILVKTGSKTCRYRPLRMADPGPRQAPVNER
jgi:hypothetical protein